MQITTEGELIRAKLGSVEDCKNLYVFGVPMLTDSGDPRPIEEVEDDLLLAITERKVERGKSVVGVFTDGVVMYLEKHPEILEGIERIKEQMIGDTE